MSTIMRLPKLGVNMTEATILSWKVKEGDFVTEGQPLFEAETDKAVQDFESPVTGVLEQILAPAGTQVLCQEPVASFRSAQQGGLVLSAARGIGEDGRQDGQSRHRGSHGHVFYVALGIFGRHFGAIALDLENAQLGPLGAALQIEGGLELLDLGDRLLEAQRVLFLIDSAEIGVLLHLQLRVLDGVGRDREFCIVSRAGLFVLCALLANLLLQIAILGLAVYRGL